LASTLSGQVVCTSCWPEADRGKVAYGTEDDLACAKRCAKKGLGQSLAVRREDGTFTLYALEPRRLAGGRAALLDAVGDIVEVEGEIVGQGEKAAVKVDVLRAVSH
jgi:hypothetical protein